MQFINIVVHSVENMNSRVFLQYEFTHLGLDQYLEVGWGFPEPLCGPGGGMGVGGRCGCHRP